MGAKQVEPAGDDGADGDGVRIARVEQDVGVTLDTCRVDRTGRQDRRREQWQIAPAQQCQPGRTVPHGQTDPMARGGKTVRQGEHQVQMAISAAEFPGEENPAGGGAGGQVALSAFPVSRRRRSPVNAANLAPSTARLAGSGAGVEGGCDVRTRLTSPRPP